MIDCGTYPSRPLRGPVSHRQYGRSRRHGRITTPRGSSKYQREYKLGVRILVWRPEGDRDQVVLGNVSNDFGRSETSLC